MLPTPKKVTIVSGRGMGKSPLTAFDMALLDAGIGNLNLIKVSSILPPEVEFVDILDIPPGSLTPTAYGYLVSDRQSEVISAAVGIGFSETQHGMIMEFANTCRRAEAEERVTKMVEESFQARGMTLKELKVAAVEQEVRGFTAVVAAAVLWY